MRLAVLLGILFSVMISVPSVAGENEEAPVAEDELEDLEAEMAELEARRMALEQAIEKKEAEQERAEELNEIREEARERLEESKAEREEMLEDEEDDIAPGWRNVRTERIKHLDKIEMTLKSIVAAETLKSATQLKRQLDATERLWWMVREPELNGEARLADMRRHVDEEEATARQRTILAKLEAIHKTDIEERKQAYELWKQEAARAEMVHALTDAFWHPEKDTELQNDLDKALEKPAGNGKTVEKKPADTVF